MLTCETTAATTLASSTMAMVSPELLAVTELSMRSPNSSLAPGFCSTDSTAKNTPEIGALKPAATPAQGTPRQGGSACPGFFHGSS